MLQYKIIKNVFAYLRLPTSIAVSALCIKVTDHSKIKFFCRVSPISTSFFCFITCTFKCTSLRLFRFKISQFVPFCKKKSVKSIENMQKGTNCENLNLKNRRLVRLKVHMYMLYNKKSCTD